MGHVQNMPSVSTLSLCVLAIASSLAAPLSGDDELPTTMLAARDTGSPTCAKPSFDCVHTTSIAIPKPVLGEALVRVNMSSVNPSDVDIVEGKFGKLFGTLGADFAGEVVSVGPLCHKLSVGDAVWGVTKGAYAEYAIVICAIVSKLGDTDPRSVGTLAEVSLTSAEAFKKAGAPWSPSKNVTVVIPSGSGGTGFVGIQIAKAYGAATVITATGGAVNAAFLKTLGADIVVDYHEHDLFSTLANNSVDVVYDNYGAAGTADKAMPSLKAGGVFIFLPGKGAALSKHPKEGVKQINYGIMVPSASLLDELLQLYKTDKLKPHVQRSYPLANVSGAFTESAAGHVLGELAIVM